jgi:hypothetical protein
VGPHSDHAQRLRLVRDQRARSAVRRGAVGASSVPVSPMPRWVFCARSRPWAAGQYPAGSRRTLEQDHMGIATGAAGPSALSVPGFDLEPRLQDDGGTGGGAPAQGAEKVFRPDQAALVDLVLSIPWQELDPSPEARLVVAPGPGRGSGSSTRWQPM